MEGYDVCFKKSSAQHLPLGEIVLSGFIDFNLVTRKFSRQDYQIKYAGWNFCIFVYKLMACDNNACDIELQLVFTQHFK